MNKWHPRPGLTLVLCALLGGGLPTAAAVEFPAGPAKWTVTVTPSHAADAPVPPVTRPMLSRLEVSQDEQAQVAIATWSSGTTQQRIFLRKSHQILVQEPDGNVLAVPEAGSRGREFNPGFDKTAFTWVKPSALVEPKPITYQGKLCLHYKATIPVPKGDDAVPGQAEASMTVEAWIDPQTGLPVAYDDGTSHADYTFLPPPYPPVVIPVEFQRAYERRVH